MSYMVLPSLLDLSLPHTVASLRALHATVPFSLFFLYVTVCAAAGGTRGFVH